MSSILTLVNYSLILLFCCFFCLISAELHFTYETEKEIDKDTIYVDDTLRFFVYSSNTTSSNIICRKFYPEIIQLLRVSQNDEKATFAARGKRLGEEYIKCSEEANDAEVVIVPVVVIRKPSLLDKVFPIYVTSMVLLLNIVFGTEVTIRDIRFILLRPKPLVAAAICQFILLPPFGLTVARLLEYEPDVALGMLMVACAPGGGNSNTASFLVGGEVPLSISMTFFSTAIAIGAMPVNLWIYGRFVSGDPNFSPENIPYLRLATALVFIVIPVGIGMILISKVPKKTMKVMRYAKPVVFILFLVFISVAIYRSLFAFQFLKVKDYFGACLIPVGGFILGAIGAMVMRLRVSQIKTIALEVGMQNAGIVISMTLVVFEQPKADLNSIMPICIALMTSAVSIPFYILHFIAYKKVPSYKEVCIENRQAQLRERESFERDVTVLPDEEHLETSLEGEQSFSAKN